MKRVYIGDGVYAHSDGENIWLESGGLDTRKNRIALNHDNWDNLLRFFLSNAPKMIAAGFLKLHEDLAKLERDEKPLVDPNL